MQSNSQLLPELPTLSLDESVSLSVSPEPRVIRGLAQRWPLVEKAKHSMDALIEYLLRFDNGQPFEAMIAPPQARGRLFYNEQMTGFNFRRMRGAFADGMTILKAFAEQEDNQKTFYFGSKNIPSHLPGLEKDNALPFLSEEIEPNIWIGNSLVIATHCDVSENIAVVAAGRRRFTLFPPDQEPNLYIGPQDPTPSGRPVSMVDLSQPDYERFPLFKNALQQAFIAELNPGDAIYIPTGWWHNVESLDAFNVLVNYWWKGVPPKVEAVIGSL